MQNEFINPTNHSNYQKIKKLIEITSQKVLDRNSAKIDNFEKKLLEKVQLKNKLQQKQLPVKESLNHIQTQFRDEKQKYQVDDNHQERKQEKQQTLNLKSFIHKALTQVLKQSQGKLNNFIEKLHRKQNKFSKTDDSTQQSSQRGKQDTIVEAKLKVVNQNDDLGKLKTRKNNNRTLSHSEMIKQIVNSPEGHQKAQDLIKKMNLQKKELNDKKRVQDLRKQEKLEKEQQEIIQIRKEQEDTQREQRVRLISEKLMKEREIRVFKTQTIKEGNKLIKQIQQRIQDEEFERKRKEDDLIRPELEKRKAELARIRKLSQPVRLDEIREHQKKYDAERLNKNLERERQKNEIQLDWVYKQNKYPKSQVLIQIEEEEKRLKLQQQQAEDTRKNRKQRESKYFQVIRDVFMIQPKVKSTDKTQLPIDKSEYMAVDVTKNQIRKIKRIVNKNSVPPFNKINQIETNQQYDDDKSQIITPQQQNTQSKLNFETTQKKISPYRGTNKTPIKKYKSIEQINFSIYIQESQAKTQRVDYLQELKQQRIKSGIQIDLTKDWEKYIQNNKLQPREKMEGVMSQIQKLEEKAKLKEMIATQNHNPNDEEEANNLYINSIKAKLALLDNKK